MIKLMNKARKQKGFTLVELMIVIAVIAILAAVLIPRSGLVQDTAREAGVETNARVVQGIVENLLPRYKADESADYIEAIVAKINAVEIINPVTNKAGAEELEDADDSVASGDVAIAVGPEAAKAATAVAPVAEYAGMVYVYVPNTLKGITITCYDKAGVLIPGATITVN